MSLSIEVMRFQLDARLACLYCQLLLAGRGCEMEFAAGNTGGSALGHLSGVAAVEDFVDRKRVSINRITDGLIFWLAGGGCEVAFATRGASGGEPGHLPGVAAREHEVDGEVL